MVEPAAANPRRATGSAFIRRLESVARNQRGSSRGTPLPSPARPRIERYDGAAERNFCKLPDTGQEVIDFAE